MSVTYTEGGIGRKACACGVFVPARTGQCPKCGHLFVSRIAEHRARQAAAQRAQAAVKVDLEKVEKPKTEREPGDGRPVLLASSGRCPVVLEGTDLAAVQVWITACAEANKEFAIGPTCASQWARQFYQIGSVEYKAVVGHLRHCRHLVEEEEEAPISVGAVQKVVAQ